MSERMPTIADLFRIPSRFLRSVQLDRDFLDANALDHLVITDAMIDAVRRMTEGLRPGSGRRAWRITGDYGVGKSAFALLLAHLTNGSRNSAVVAIERRLGAQDVVADGTSLLTPVLLTGMRAGLVPTLAKGIGAAVLESKSGPRKVRFVQQVASLVALAEATGSVTTLEELLEIVRAQLAKEGRGLLLIVDELGKHLEFAAAKPESEDVFVLQRLAEIAARSGERPFLLVGLLHQGFQAYAERLPTSVKHEWDKVAGRFDEIVFDQPLMHTAALVAGALNVDPARLPAAVSAAARGLAVTAARTGWFGRRADGDLDVAPFYPLHPTLLPVLVRFFARFGQNERSLFGFLLSSEAFGLQSFAERKASPDEWYGLPEFYDYVRASFGHRLAGGSFRSQWLRIQSSIEAATDRNGIETRILKAVAVLNLLDADDLLPSVDGIAASLEPTGEQEVREAVSALRREGHLYERGRGGALRLWPGSSVGLEAALALAARTLGPVERVSPFLGEHLDREPLLARRHYVDTGTMRYFGLRYSPVDTLAEAALLPSDGDGTLLVVLADTEAERRAAVASAMSEAIASRPDMLVCIGEPLGALAAELQDLRCWKWVSENTPELVEDAHAAAEVFRELSAARRELTGKLYDTLGLKGRGTGAARWFREGREVARLPRGGVSALVSAICDELYPSAPRVANELLNRNQLGSAAAAARMRLIEGLFNASDREHLGMDSDKHPPERSMYMSVLQKGLVHRKQSDGYRLVEPEPGSDPLSLAPALRCLVDAIVDARGDRVSAMHLLERLKGRPYGVRNGLAPLLLAVMLRMHAHEIAVYERGTFLHRFGASDFLRLTKSPASFEIQLCKVEGVRLEVFRRLASVFGPVGSASTVDLLDVVRPLCQFAAQLPEYTRRSVALSPVAMAVRDALLSAREPSTLLFSDLPAACGFPPPSSDGPSGSGHVDDFVERLEEAISELRGAYPALLERTVRRLREGLGDAGKKDFDRTALAAKAADVATVAKEPRLKAFVGRLRDPGLSDDAWAEALASFVVSKPPVKWIAGDEARFGEEVASLSQLFNKADQASFVRNGRRRTPDAILLNLTRGDGADRSAVVHAWGGTSERDALLMVRNVLPDEREARMRMLVDLLWADIEGAAEANGEVPASDRRKSEGTR